MQTATGPLTPDHDVWTREEAIETFGVTYLHSGSWRDPIREVLGGRPADPFSPGFSTTSEADAISRVRKAAKKDAEREVSDIDTLLESRPVKMRLAVARNFRIMRGGQIGILATESILDSRRREHREVLRNGVAPEIDRLPSEVVLPTVLAVGCPVHVVDTRKFPAQSMETRTVEIARLHVVDPEPGSGLTADIRYEVPTVMGLLGFEGGSRSASLTGTPSGLAAFIDEGAARAHADRYARGVFAKLNWQGNGAAPAPGTDAPPVHADRGGPERPVDVRTPMGPAKGTPPANGQADPRPVEPPVRAAPVEPNRVDPVEGHPASEAPLHGAPFASPAAADETAPVEAVVAKEPSSPGPAGIPPVPFYDLDRDGVAVPAAPDVSEELEAVWYPVEAGAGPAQPVAGVPEILVEVRPRRERRGGRLSRLASFLRRKDRNTNIAGSAAVEHGDRAEPPLADYPEPDPVNVEVPRDPDAGKAMPTDRDPGLGALVMAAIEVSLDLSAHASEVPVPGMPATGGGPRSDAATDLVPAGPPPGEVESEGPAHAMPDPEPEPFRFDGREGPMPELRAFLARGGLGLCRAAGAGPSIAVRSVEAVTGGRTASTPVARSTPEPMHEEPRLKAA